MDPVRSSLLTGAGETRSLGEKLGRLLRPGDWVALRGDLGAGKTTLVSGIVEGVHPGLRSRSPTYVRVEIYGASPAIVHADLYRLESPEEWDTLGVEDMARDAIVLVEWADKAPGRLPEERLDIALEYAGEEARSIRMDPRGPRWEGFQIA
ncbi:MAG TPA: tRNA (adenosine(37)-N6)-threonylcarbamoyltransferase complex ATPase subunit type 1 TsaE [Candidatus Angelobacter sp.]|nr:tRNA (adenosine(37)-N6)-threonylcarbamoyltransferase complex ATPase subunit type 1 TsaE [Candidatus Angelobacter sp.]